MSDELIDVAPHGFDALKEKLAFYSSVIGVGVGILCILGTFAARLSVNTEIMSHFYLEYFLILLVLIPPMFWLRKYLTGAFLGICLLLCVWRLLPLYLPVDRTVPSDASRVSVVQLNVDYANKNLNPAMSYIKNANADLVCLEEVTEAMVPHLVDGLKDKYPYYFSAARRDSFGLMVFSKHQCPMQAHEFGQVGFPCIVTKMEVAGKPVTVVAVHTIPPYDEAPLSTRNAEMMGIAKDRRLLGERYLICGDLNCTTWSPYFQDMLNAGQLHDSMMGFGVQPSWPMQVVVLQIPIDQVLSSKQFVTLQRKIGPSVGSDHFPLFAELALVQ